MPGVELHANTALTILNGFPIKTCQAGLVLPIYALICIIPALFRKSPLFLTLVVFGLILSLILASILLFLHHGKILKIAAPGFAIFLTWFWCWLSGYALTLREKIKIKQAFSKYIPPILIREILKNPKMLNPGGEKRNLTVLFSDIREITSISEQLSPEDLVLFLNQFHTQATELIFKHKGLLDKYIGDAVMAVYGAPVPIEDHPYQACKTALAMKTDLDQDNLAAWQDKGLPKPDFGIGINTGWMILGNMGSKKLFDYTVIGDAVNLASRLEGLNKFYQTKIIISESTYAHVKKKFPLQGVGPSQGQRKGSANQDLRAPGRL